MSNETELAKARILFERTEREWRAMRLKHDAETEQLRAKQAAEIGPIADAQAAAWTRLSDLRLAAGLCPVCGKANQTAQIYCDEHAVALGSVI